MKFPVFSLHNREFGSETGSLETASSSSESYANLSSSIMADYACSPYSFSAFQRIIAATVGNKSLPRWGNIKQCGVGFLGQNGSFWITRPVLRGQVRACLCPVRIDLSLRQRRQHCLPFFLRRPPRFRRTRLVR